MHPNLRRCSSVEYRLVDMRPPRALQDGRLGPLGASTYFWDRALATYPARCMIDPADPRSRHERWKSCARKSEALSSKSETNPNDPMTEIPNLVPDGACISQSSALFPRTASARTAGIEQSDGAARVCRVSSIGAFGIRACFEFRDSNFEIVPQAIESNGPQPLPGGSSASHRLRQHPWAGAL
jgi:hypothetical protein